MTAVSSAAAAGVRSCAGLVLELEVEQSEALGMLYGFLRTCWTRRGDQMVTGAASTASSATAEVRPWWGGGYGEGTRGRRGGNGGVAHRGCSGRRSGLGDALETANRRRRWSEPEEGNGDVAAMQGFRGAVERWGGRGSRGGAPELVGGARGGRRRRLWRTAATVVFGRERERERVAREREGDKARGSGRHREEAPQRRAGGGGRQTSWWRGAPAVRARRPHAWPTGARRTTAVVGWAGLLGQRRQVRFPSFISVF